MVRGHLELSGITTVEALAGPRRWRPGRVAVALAVLQHEGFALQGRYTAEAPSRPSGWPAACWPACTATPGGPGGSGCSRPPPRTSCASCSRWQHVAPGTQLAGDAGLAAVIEQLQGFEAAAVAWEPELLARRLHHYSPGWLDRLCHDGEVAWLRLAPRPRSDVDGPAAAPSKATPDRRGVPDRPALAARRGPGRPPPAAARRSAPPPRSSRSCGRRGASFAADLAAATRRLPDDVERGLWDGVTRGLIMCDGFGAIRARVSPGGRQRPPAGAAPVVAPGPDAATDGRVGRAVVPRSAAPDGRAATATNWPKRWPSSCCAGGASCSGTWPCTTRSGCPGGSCSGRCAGWRTGAWSGAGRFVTGFSGEQYALPEAAEQLAHVRKTAAAAASGWWSTPPIRSTWSA